MNIFPEIALSEEVINPDRVHPNPDGHYHMAKCFLAFQGIELGDSRDFQNLIIIRGICFEQRPLLASYPSPNPISFFTTHPVDTEDLGKKMYVLLIGIDENCEVAGYAVVEEFIG